MYLRIGDVIIVQLRISVMDYVCIMHNQLLICVIMLIYVIRVLTF